MNKKYSKLGFSIVLDIIGFFTIIPLDFLWAPIAGFIMTKMYKGTKGKIAGIISFLEELIPFSDFIPTFTLMWFYTYVFKNKESENSMEL